MRAGIGRGELLRNPCIYQKSVSYIFFYVLINTGDAFCIILFELYVG